MLDLPPVKNARLRAFTLFAALAACGGDTTYVTAPPDGDLPPDAPLPGVVVTIESIDGGSLPGGNARPGDRLAVVFRVADRDGAPLDLARFAVGRAMVSGPTFDRQRVLAEETNVLARAQRLAAGRYRFGFAAPIPAAYLPPLHDTPALQDGERTGEPLLSGTYTLGLALGADYAGEDGLRRDLGSATRDFLLGSATELEPRAVAGLPNCTQCHGALSAHGAYEGSLEICLLCHTHGAEDRSGTGTSIDFRVMVHKIHAGRALPSVLGVATRADGTRDYGAAPRPYVVQGESSHDYSDVGYPVWPSMTVGMPRDAEYGALLPDAQAKEDLLLRGPVDCASCHGDPDGDGPIAAPAQGALIESQLTRSACASCHDDWDPARPYVSNGQPMPPQQDDSDCLLCHAPSDPSLGVAGAHRHPLRDPSFAPGLQVAIGAVTDEGGDDDGVFDAGEFVRIDFTVTDGQGAAVVPAGLSRLEAVLSGPTSNPNLVHVCRIPTPSLGPGPALSMRLPETIALEYVGDSDATLNQFTTLRPNHRNVPGFATNVFVEISSFGLSTLAAAAPAGQNWFELVDAAGASTGQVLRIGTGNEAEWVQIRHLEGNRAYLSSRNNPTFGSGPAALPIASGLRRTHAAGAPIAVSVLFQPSPFSFSVAAAAGTIAEIDELGSGPVLVSYTGDYVVPAAYPGALNESPDLEASWGDWTGLPLLPGRYQLTLAATRNLTKGVFGQTTAYVEASEAATFDLHLGDGDAAPTPPRLDDFAGCARCHQDLQFHGGFRRGFAGCLSCHGQAGAEDAPRYVYPSADATPSATVDFRTMLHKIHHGRALAAGPDYRIVGFGGIAHSYEKVGFPAHPGGQQDCAFCHGADNTAWRTPAARTHPLQTLETRVWRSACGSCHDSGPAQAHIDANTSPTGAESCAVCHGDGKEHSTLAVHRVR